MAEIPDVPAGVTFTSAGVDYYLPRTTQDLMDVFEAYCCGQALDRVKRMAQFQTPADNARAYEEVARQIKIGSLGWDTPDGFEARRTVDGLVRLCWLAIRSRKPDVKLEDIQAVVRREGADFLFERYLAANADPLARPSAASVAGGNSAPGSPSNAASVGTTSANSPTLTSGAAT